MPQKLYTYQEVASLLGYKTPRKIYELVKNGELKVIKVNQKVHRIKESEVKKLLKKYI
jgi:excisionase family DNA binding protein